MQRERKKNKTHFLDKEIVNFENSAMINLTLNSYIC